MSEPTDILALIEERLTISRLGGSIWRETDKDLIALRKAGEALRAVESRLEVIQLCADKIDEYYGDEWDHTGACQAFEADDLAGVCPLCAITSLAREGINHD